MVDKLFLYLTTYKCCCQMQVIDNDNNCYNSVCGSRAVDNEDDDEDILENWDDEDAGGTNNRVLNSHDSDDEVVS